MPDPEGTITDPPKVTPLRDPDKKPPLSPAERAQAILLERVGLRDMETALPRIAAELARANALRTEEIRLQQVQINLVTRCVDLLSGQMTNGPAVQMKMLDRFGEMFAPIMALITSHGDRPGRIGAPPTPSAPVEHAGPGYSVEGDPAEATRVEE